MVLQCAEIGAVPFTECPASSKGDRTGQRNAAHTSACNRANAGQSKCRIALAVFDRTVDSIPRFVDGDDVEIDLPTVAVSVHEIPFLCVVIDDEREAESLKHVNRALHESQFDRDIEVFVRTGLVADQ